LALLVNRFWSFVVDYAFFEGALALRLRRNTNSLLGSSSWNGFIIAVKLNFSDSVITSQLDRTLTLYTLCYCITVFEAFFGSPWSRLASGSSRMAANSFSRLALWSSRMAADFGRLAMDFFLNFSPVLNRHKHIPFPLFNIIS